MKSRRLNATWLKLKLQTSVLSSCVCGLALLAAAPRTAAAQEIDARSAPRWVACTNWVTKPPVSYSVTSAKNLLVFSAEGANTELPWLLNLKDAGVTGDERYLLIRYQAEGLSTNPGNYFLHGEEGSRGGRAYAMADQVKPDGRWHTLAVDLASIDPLEATHSLAIKVLVDDRGKAKLTIEHIRFADELPEGAQIAKPPSQRPEQTITIDWRQRLDIRPQGGWTTSPANEFGSTRDGSAMVFTVRGQNTGMRWLMSLPKAVDLSRTPYLSLRYKASGQLAGSAYAIWLGNTTTGATKKSMIALPANELKNDSSWHQFTTKLEGPFTATQLAIGLDCASLEATLAFDAITFSSRPRRWGLAEVLDYTPLAQAWPDGKDGFQTVAVSVKGGKPSAFLTQRLGLSNWFTSPHVAVTSVPFDVPTNVGTILQSATGDFGTLSLTLPAGAREIYLLVAAAAPATEPWGIDWAHPRPVEMLDVPEKVVYEIRYASGPSDWVLPLDANSAQWGLRRGVSVSVVHPDLSRQPVELRLHDRMQTASFAIIGATIRRDATRVREPDWDHLAWQTPLAKPLAGLPKRTVARESEAVVGSGVLEARFDTRSGLAWSQLGIPGLSNHLSCATAPVFEVSVSGKVLAAKDWSLEQIEVYRGGRRFRLRNSPARLGAQIECVPGQLNELLLRMKLINEGLTATTATLRFPMLRNLCLGSANETHYLCGKRGGIIHSATASFREPLGERHPLQMDGFFNPASGLALACLTHDTNAQHHFINLAKTDRGGSWSVEYVERDLAPGQTFESTEAALVLREGDWRAIFTAYQEWLSTWFKPAAPRKPWFEQSFALVTGNGHYDAVPDSKARGAIQPTVNAMRKYIGVCDYVHRFGWGASKEFGDWGDYGHYEEIGGLHYFRENIQQLQRSGVAVSLYLDGYLNSSKGQFAGKHAKEWAMKRTDGTPQFVDVYQAYNECPYLDGWQQYLSDTYRRVQQELGSKIMYIDEYGATDGRWKCQARDHGHNGYEIPYAGEVAMLKRIREAVGPEIVLYTEYPPAEASRRYLDGSITYQALWSADQESLAPHFIDLPRFAFPDFKQMHIIYYVSNRAGNWWLLKFPFFNGEVYRIGEPNLPGMDEPSLAFLRRAVQVQCAHRETLASSEVEPLVPTEVSGVFANRFTGPRETVWTLYNANGRNVRGPVLRVKHVPGTVYEDAWNGSTQKAQLEEGYALVSLDLGPKGVGCLVQRKP